MVVIKALEEGKWLLRQHLNPEYSQHNHRRSIRPSAYPFYRRLITAIRAIIKLISRRVKIRACNIQAIVWEQHPESILTRKDIYNARSLINRDKFNGYIPIAVLIELLTRGRFPISLSGRTTTHTVFLALSRPSPTVFRYGSGFLRLLALTLYITLTALSSYYSR
jgi:TRAP-type uncharacterized transport system fused permease subunit